MYGCLPFTLKKKKKKQAVNLSSYSGFFLNCDEDEHQTCVGKYQLTVYSTEKCWEFQIDEFSLRMQLIKIYSFFPTVIRFSE